jgi:hypothetical protein
MSDEEGSKKIKVVDKRRFTSDGDTRADAPDDAPERQATAPEPPVQEPPQASGGQSARIDFISFVASLATNALGALGALPPEAGIPSQLNPDLAREYIDIIVMLRDKTAGNLSPQEEQALQRMISDLQLRFVEVTRKR